MDANTKNAVRRVLTDAANTEHFFDFSDAERLNWMLAYAYQLGVAARTKQPAKRQVVQRKRRRRSLVAAG